MEITGPMKLKLHLQVQNPTDVNIFAGIRKLRGGKHVVFEGSYGFAYDMVTNGWLKASLRKLDEANSKLWRPAHTFDTMEPLKPGQTVELDIALLPSATFFKKGDVMQLDIQGRWFFKYHMIFGTKSDYEKSPEGKCTLFSGVEFDSHLLVPIIKKDHSG
jgi:predicted acyl esterase